MTESHSTIRGSCNFTEPANAAARSWGPGHILTAAHCVNAGTLGWFVPDAVVPGRQGSCAHSSWTCADGHAEEPWGTKNRRDRDRAERMDRQRQHRGRLRAPRALRRRFLGHVVRARRRRAARAPRACRISRARHEPVRREPGPRAKLLHGSALRQGVRGLRVSSGESSPRRRARSSTRGTTCRAGTAVARSTRTTKSSAVFRRRTPTRGRPCSARADTAVLCNWMGNRRQRGVRARLPVATARLRSAPIPAGNPGSYLRTHLERSLLSTRDPQRADRRHYEKVRPRPPERGAAGGTARTPKAPCDWPEWTR